MSPKKTRNGIAKRVVGNHVNQWVVPNSHRNAKDSPQPIANITGDTRNGSIMAKPRRVFRMRVVSGFKVMLVNGRTTGGSEPEQSTKRSSKRLVAGFDCNP